MRHCTGELVASFGYPEPADAGCGHRRWALLAVMQSRAAVSTRPAEVVVMALVKIRRVSGLSRGIAKAERWIQTCDAGG